MMNPLTYRFRQIKKLPGWIFFLAAKILLGLRHLMRVELIDEELFFQVIKGGFGQRRKTLHNALTGVHGMSKEQIAEVLAAADIAPNRRAETLSIEEFARIANIIAGK